MKKSSLDTPSTAFAVPTTPASTTGTPTSTGDGAPGAGAASTDGQMQRCDTYITTALTSNKTIQFLLERLERMGCTPPDGFLSCQNCDGKPVSGGFGMLVQQDQVLGDGHDLYNDDGSMKDDPTKVLATNHDNNIIHQKRRHRRPDCTRSIDDIRETFQKDQEGTIRLSLQPDIYLCAEHVTGPQHASTILTHELIHAIDYCRSDMDPLRNCLQLACTEIRAENLSGECNIQWEVLRGKLDSFRGHGKDCVRRRAIDSVQANPNCGDQASLYVDAAMERCYADTFPFERHPNQR
jgi:mitochondrial inner membrane protease ATP23